MYYLQLISIVFVTICVIYWLLFGHSTTRELCRVDISITTTYKHRVSYIITLILFFGLFFYFFVFVLGLWVISLAWYWLCKSAASKSAFLIMRSIACNKWVILWQMYFESSIFYRLVAIASLLDVVCEDDCSQVGVCSSIGLILGRRGFRWWYWASSQIR